VTQAAMLKEVFVIEAVFGFCAITVNVEEIVEHRKCITCTHNTA
jgi:hypothetical protein